MIGEQQRLVQRQLSRCWTEFRNLFVGNRNSNEAPSPGWLCAEITPPMIFHDAVDVQDMDAPHGKPMQPSLGIDLEELKKEMEDPSYGKIAATRITVPLPAENVRKIEVNYGLIIQFFPKCYFDCSTGDIRSELSYEFCTATREIRQAIQAIMDTDHGKFSLSITLKTAVEGIEQIRWPGQAIEVIHIYNGGCITFEQ